MTAAKACGLIGVNHGRNMRRTGALESLSHSYDGDIEYAIHWTVCQIGKKIAQWVAVFQT